MNNTDFEIVDGVLVKCHSRKAHVDVPEGVTSIGSAAFSGCRLESIALPDGLTSIGDGAFQQCRFQHQHITLPHGLTRIPKNSFWRCAVRSVTIPHGVTVIEDNAFSECVFLEHVTIPETVTKIGRGAFGGCHSLEITVPESVTELDDSAFVQSMFYDEDPPTARETISDSGAITAPTVTICHTAPFYRGFIKHPELYDSEKKAVYLRAMTENLEVTDAILSEMESEDFVTFVEMLRPEGELLDALLDITTAVGKPRLTTIVLEYRNRNGGENFPIKKL